MSKCSCKGLEPCICRKVDLRIECYTCGYPYSEARYPDKETPMDCQASYKELRKHIEEVK